MINLDHYTNILYEEFHQALTVRTTIERSQIINLDNLNKYNKKNCHQQHRKEIFHIYVLRTRYKSRVAMPPSAHDEQTI